MKQLVWVCLGLLATVGHAQVAPAADVTEVRARIARDRAEANARYAAQEAQCYQKFAVNDCLENARQLRRQSLGVLAREEMGLNEARRREAGEARVRTIENKSRADAERMALERDNRAQAPDARRSQRLRGQTDTVAPAPPKSERRKAKDKKTALTTAEKAQAERAFEKKQLEAASRREALARKQAARTKPPAAPLPPVQ